MYKFFLKLIKFNFFAIRFTYPLSIREIKFAKYPFPMYINVQARGICRSRGECFLPIMRVPIERSEIQETTCQNEFTFDPCTLYIRFVHTMQSIGSCRLPFPLSDCGTSVWRPPLRFISTKFRRILIMYVTCSNLWYMYIHICIYTHKLFPRRNGLRTGWIPFVLKEGTNNPFKSS